MSEAELKKLRTDRDAALAKVVELRAALKKYGAHHSACILSSRALMDAHPTKHHICSCGLSDVLASIIEPPKDESHD